MKKKYRIVVEGKAYEVEVEEIATETTTTTTTTLPPATTTRPITPARPVRTQISPKSVPTVSLSSDSTQQGGIVKAPIPGTVLRVNFKEGDSINQGDIILILEAMKMENEINAPQSGIIKQIVALNTTVDFGAVLCIIE